MTATEPATIPARKLTPRGEAKRTEILLAAADLFFKRGIAGVSIEDVNKAAHASASQVYLYFGDKQGLIRAVVEYQADSVIGLQGDLLFQLDSVAALREWADLHVAIQRERHCAGGCAFGSLASQLNEAQPAVRDTLAEGFERWEAPIAAGLARMKTRGELPEYASPEALAMSMVAALQGGLLLTQTQRSLRPLEAALDAQIKLIELLQAEAERR